MDFWDVVLAHALGTLIAGTKLFFLSLLFWWAVKRRYFKTMIRSYMKDAMAAGRDAQLEIALEEAKRERENAGPLDTGPFDPSLFPDLESPDPRDE